MFGNFLHRHRFACQNLKHDILDIKAALADTTIISDYHCKTQHHLDSRLNRVKYDGIHCCGTGEPLSIVSVNIQDSRTIVSNKCEEFPYEDILESPSSIGELLSACLNNTILTTPEYARSAVFSTHREYNCRELIVPGVVCCKLQYKCTYNPYAAFFELFHDIIQVDTYLTLGSFWNVTDAIFEKTISFNLMLLNWPSRQRKIRSIRSSPTSWKLVSP